MTKQIFIEMISDPQTGEQVFVDWNKGFGSFLEVICAMQQAIGAVAQEQQKQIQLQQKKVIRPDFVPQRDN
jgi:hypothetical protein